MSSTRWICGLAAAVMVTTAASMASAEAADSRWSALTGRAVVVEKQDGTLVAGELVAVREQSVEVEAPDGSRAVVERAAVKALRSKLRGAPVTVTMKENDEKIAGKLIESDDRTIVVETDDGRRVTLEHTTVKTVRERDAKARASASVAKAPARAPYIPTEDLPPNGTDLIRAGAALLGSGLGLMVSAPSWKFGSALDPSTQDAGMYLELGAGALFVCIGTGVLVGGTVQRSKFDEWMRVHGAVGFAPTRGGGALTWQGTF